MARSAVLKIDIISDFNDAGMKSASGKLKDFGKQANVAAAAVGGALVAGSIKAVGAAEKGATANARLASVLGQTAGASDEVVKAVQDQASELAKLTGIDDDIIKGGQGILGTFKSVAQSAGDTGGVFDRATVAAADLAAAGFGSVESNATSLGKALEDPIKGLSSLARQGVTFTEAQQEMIAAMVEGGDVAGAQSQILAAIEGQVGGTAEATANASDKMKESWDEAWEALGVLLLPALDVLAEKMSALSSWVQDNTDKVAIFAGILAGFVATVAAANVALKIYRGIMLAVRAATLLWQAGQWLLNIALTANPIGLIIAAIAALIAIIAGVLYWTRDKWIPVLKAVWDWIKRAAGAIWDGLGAALDWVVGKIRAVWDWVQRLIAKLRELARKAREALSNLNPFSGGGLFGGIFGRSATTYYAPATTRGARTAATGTTRTGTITLNAYADPQQQARDLVRVLTGARVRTGLSGIPA